jgi:hypothetical protein
MKQKYKDSCTRLDHTKNEDARGSTRPLTEMSTRNLPGGKGQPAREADNLTIICGPTV